MHDISSSGKVASGKNQNFKFLAWLRHYFQIFENWNYCFWKTRGILKFSQDLISVYDFSLHARSIRYLAGEYQCHRWLTAFYISADRPFIYSRGLVSLVVSHDDRRRYACVPSQRERERNYGISENDFERFVCVCVEVARCSALFKSKLLWSTQKNRREKSCFAFKGSLPIDNDWWVSIEDQSKYSNACVD